MTFPKRNGFYLNERKTQYYFLNDKIHREDGPAIETAAGYVGWYKHGLPHRLDGPAIKYSDGHLEWWYEGFCFKDCHSQEEFEKYIKLKAFW